jgi:hypothetical protein
MCFGLRSQIVVYTVSHRAFNMLRRSLASGVLRRRMAKLLPCSSSAASPDNQRLSAYLGCQWPSAAAPQHAAQTCPRSLGCHRRVLAMTPCLEWALPNGCLPVPTRTVSQRTQRTVPRGMVATGVGVIDSAWRRLRIRLLPAAICSPLCGARLGIESATGGMPWRCTARFAFSPSVSESCDGSCLH